jgi:hypothetical protein
MQNAKRRTPNGLALKGVNPRPFFDGLLCHRKIKLLSWPNGAHSKSGRDLPRHELRLQARPLLSAIRTGRAPRKPWSAGAKATPRKVAAGLGMADPDDGNSKM